MTGTARKIIDTLPKSPTDITDKHTVKKIQQYIPVPTDFHILWADIQSYGGYPCGIVFTEEALILKAPKDSVDKENEKRKKANKELKKSGEKDKEKMQGMLPVLYQIVPWEYFETSLYTLVETKDPKGNRLFILKYGDGEIARFSNSFISKFFIDYAAEEKRINDIIATVASSSNFAAMNALEFDNVMFHAAYGVDQSKTGHGIYAEHAGSMLDRLAGERSSTVGQDLDENGHYAKDGPDKIVNGINIQCKYCRSAGDSVRNCFRKDADGNYVYRYFNAADGSPMPVEVAKDQRTDAVRLMRDRIEKGQVPGVTNPDDAEKLIRQGRLTKQQARNLAKAGTFESITYDAVTGAVNCAAVCGISALVSFGSVFWATDGDLDKAANAALYTGLEVFGPLYAAHLISSQLARTGFSKSLIPATDSFAKSLNQKMLRRMVNAFRALSGKGPISGAAVPKTFGKALRTTAFTQAVMLVAFSVPNTYNVFAGKASGAQYVKDMTSLVASFGGTAAGGFGAGLILAEHTRKTGEKIDKKIGGAIGFAAGAVVGTGASVAARAIGNLFHEDDALITTRLFNAALANTCLDYMLADAEIDAVIAKLDEKDTSKAIKKLQKKLISSDAQYQDIIDFLTPIADEIVEKRPKITAAMESEMLKYMDEAICNEVEGSNAE